MTRSGSLTPRLLEWRSRYVMTGHKSVKTESVIRASEVLNLLFRIVDVCGVEVEDMYVILVPLR